MARLFPLFVDLSGKKIAVYGAGRIASRRIKALLAFAPLLRVTAPEAEAEIISLAKEGKLLWRRELFRAGEIPADVCFVLAATDDKEVNRQIANECKEKGIPVNVCSERELCDFQFPGLALGGDLVIGINAGGENHSLARRWTEKIRKEVEEDGSGAAAEEASDNGDPEKDGAGDADGQERPHLPHVCEGGGEY